MQLETRQAQLFWQLTDKFSSKEGLDYLRVLGEATWSSHEEWLEKYKNDIKYDNAYRWLATILNCRGVFLREDLLDVRLLALIESVRERGPTIYWWEKHRDVIINERKRLNNRRYCSEWEYSYNLLVKYLEEHPELARAHSYGSLSPVSLLLHSALSFNLRLFLTARASTPRTFAQKHEHVKVISNIY